MQDSAHPDPKHASIEAFEKLEMRIGTIKAVKEHPQVNEYVLLIDLGSVEQDVQLVANLKESYAIEELIGKQICIVVNTREQEILGIESQGLLLTTTKDGKTILLTPDHEVHPGVKVYGLVNEKYSHHSHIGK